jgi:tRNA(fMet)-specific endonuclease VapC
MILIDTDICIELLRGNKKVIQKRIECPDDIGISFMSAAELFYGAEKSGHTEKNKVLVQEFLLSITIIDPDISIAERFGAVKAGLYRDGNMLADADIFIAATALERCDRLITGNTAHFNRIPELRIENWIK